jgi:hypothetical protein
MMTRRAVAHLALARGRAVQDSGVRAAATDGRHAVSHRPRGAPQARDMPVAGGGATAPTGAGT